MQTWKKIQKPLLSLLAYLIVAVVVAYLLFERHPTALAQGTIAPIDSTFIRLNGASASVKRLLKKPLLINFFATWCPPCHKEMPILSKLAKAYQGQVSFLGLAADHNVDGVIAWQEKFILNFELGLADDGMQTRWQANILPTTYLLDPRGKILWSHTGAVTEEQLENALKTALN